MKKNIILFCCGLSGSGKSFFINNYLPTGLFHKLVSATSRPMRQGETDGREYYFRDEQYFDTTPLATHIWANQPYWKPGMPKWLYGVPATEIMNNIGKNMTYDVIQPKYARQLIDWCHMHNLDYDFRVAYFIPTPNRHDIIASRTNMPCEQLVRQNNTCDPIDFLRAGLDINFLIKCSAQEVIIPQSYKDFIASLKQHTK